MAARKTTTNRSATAKPAPKDTAIKVETSKIEDGVIETQTAGVEPVEVDVEVVTGTLSADKIVAADVSADAVLAVDTPKGDAEPLDEFLVQALWNEYRVDLIQKYGRTYVDRFARIAEEAFIEGLRKGHDAG